MCVCVCVRVCVCVHVFMYVCICMYVCNTHAHMYIVSEFDNFGPNPRISGQFKNELYTCLDLCTSYIVTNENGGIASICVISANIYENICHEKTPYIDNTI